MKKKPATEKATSTRNPAVFVRVPPTIKPQLEADAARYGCSEQAMILWIVGRHYGVEIESVPRGRPKKVKES